MEVSHEKKPLIHYFPYLTSGQRTQFALLESHYKTWNARLNLISRKDIGNFYIRHILHSLSIGKVVSFQPKSRLLDVGTGGGFPGIPLAILFPEAHFTLVDSIGKKVRAVQHIADSLGLENVTLLQKRAENIVGQYDFIVGRAVTSLPKIYGWVQDKIKKKSMHALCNGLLYLRGNLEAVELEALPSIQYETYSIGEIFSDPFFRTKYLVHLWANL